MKLTVLCSLILFCFHQNLFAQKKPNTITIQCVIVSSDSTEPNNFNATLVSTDSKRQYILSGNSFIVNSKGKYTLTIQAPAFFDFNKELNIYSDTILRIEMKENIIEQQNVVVKAVQVREKSGFVHSELNARQISANNLGQDFTYLIGNTPSAVTTSDAGAGIGYTGIRIRGSDATHINVTINGIPINDAESHGVFWVNMPDLASSSSSVQIQRGVGSSTVGNGAFGANINIQNTDMPSKAYLQIQESFGSFNTWRSTLQFGTGKIGALNFSGRLSKIISDGYIDRSSSNLQAFQFNLNYTLKKWNINAVSFGGKEKTYQSWYGTPESRIKNDVDAMNQYADRNYLSDAERNNLLNSGRTYNYYTYKNQTDNYWQNHYQLHAVREINKGLFLKASMFATQGKGYYEEYKPGAPFAKYGVGNYKNGNDTQTSTDLVRQRWLDNLYYGGFLSANYKKNATELIAGLNMTQYDGKHHGDVVWAAIAQPFGKDYRYYQSKSSKSELNTFIKANHKFSKQFQVDLELQYRNIHYSASGTDNDNATIQFDTVYHFINPKAALVYELNMHERIYTSYSIGQREPVRTDFIDHNHTQLPKPEFLQDFELGYIYKRSKTYLQCNLYNMNYRNQLVLTGELNDVGSSLRTNVSRSYRRGVEFIFQNQIVKKLNLDLNVNLSQNRILNFEDVYYKYSTNFDTVTPVKDVYRSTDIAFSPSVIAYLGISDHHLKGLDLNLNCKYVGKQYLDNTSNKLRSMNAYYTLNFSFQKTINLKSNGRIILKGMVNNMTGIFYSNNGYTYKYVYSGKLITENFYYPQSGINFMLGLDFKFL